MITKPTADDAPEGYWSNRELETLGQKWKFKGERECHKHLGDVLAYSESFMEDYLNREVQYFCDMVKVEDEVIKELWEEHCKWSMNRAGYETEQEWITAYTEYANRAPPDAVYEWAYKRVMDDASGYWEVIRELCRDSNDGLRADHPIVGVYSESYGTVHPLEEILGWCPTCNESLVRGDITIGRDLFGSGEEVEIFHCPNCGAADPVQGFEEKFGRPFHLPINPNVFMPIVCKEVANGGEITFRNTSEAND